MQNDNPNNLGDFRYGNENRGSTTSTCQMLLNLYNNSTALITHAGEMVSSFVESALAPEPLRRLTQSQYDPVEDTRSNNTLSSDNTAAEQRTYQARR